MSMPEAELDLLDRLVGFETVAGTSNLDLIDWAQTRLQTAGFRVERINAPCGTKAGILARFGSRDGGVLFSAHTDVVPVEGQAWSGDPFRLRRSAERVSGRGTTDMKGFIACLLALADGLRAHPPARPVAIALSWDEEIGCLGIPHMLDRVVPVLGRPDLCVVGEPTSLRLGIGHKGKGAYEAVCRGEPGHSSLAPRFTNALHLAADLIAALRREQARLAREGARDPAFDIPYSTVHAGLLRGGTALNMMPERAELVFEIRHIASETPQAILAALTRDLPEAIEITARYAYPGLETDPLHPAHARLRGLLADPAPVKAARRASSRPSGSRRSSAVPATWRRATSPTSSSRSASWCTAPTFCEGSSTPSDGPPGARAASTWTRTVSDGDSV
jgi:acetylornithine deacetylase